MTGTQEPKPQPPAKIPRAPTGAGKKRDERHVRRGGRLGKLCLVLAALCLAFWLALGLAPDPLAREGGWDWTVTVTDRHGRRLREIRPPNQTRREDLTLAQFSPSLVQAVVAAEDRRFWSHPGFDPLAAARALVGNLRAGRVVSGASTITMQAARLSLGLGGERTLSRKLREILLALRLERHHGKEEILALYLNCAPVGGPNLGFQSAARAWLGKSAGALSAAEAAFLAALPASPGPPGRAGPRLRKRQASIIARLRDRGYLSEQDARRALAEPLVPAPSGQAFAAPHLTEKIASSLRALTGPNETGPNGPASNPARGPEAAAGPGAAGDADAGPVSGGGDDRAAGPNSSPPRRPRQPDAGKTDFFQAALLGTYGAGAGRPGQFLPPRVIRTTVDANLQEKMERLAARTAARHRSRGMSQAAVLVMSLPEREILAYVGSSDFFGGPDGQIDGVTTPRQPGSALKPFLYALGLDRRVITAATLIDDRPHSFNTPRGSYSPRNYSEKTHGPVPARLALASSLNLPAVNLASSLGLENLLAQLKNLGLDTLSEDEDHYGLGLALGGGEVTLLSLASAYAALAEGGLLAEPVLFLGGDEKNPGTPPPPAAAARRVMSPQAAFIVSDILADPLARETGFGSGGPLATMFRSSVKTGTSKNYRDNWCLGYTDGFLVAVWAGNFQNDPMSDISGVTGAGYLWRDAVDLLASEKAPAARAPSPPPGVTTALVCPLSGLAAGPGCPNASLEYFLAGTEPAGTGGPPPAGGAGAGAGPASRTDGVVGFGSKFGFLSPRSGETYAYDPGTPAEQQAVTASVRLAGGADEIRLTRNGRVVAQRKVAGGAAVASVRVPLVRGRQELAVAGLLAGEVVGTDRAVFLVK